MKRFASNRISPAHLVCSAAYALAAVLALRDWRLSAVPLALFVIVCIIAPFLTRWGFFLPVIARGSGKDKAVALTFDDGPDPIVTPLVLDLLAKHGLTSDFFVAGKRAEANPGIMRRALSEGHAIGNHTYNHSPLIMLRGNRALARDIDRAQEMLAGFGIIPLAFRPPAGITNPKLGRVLHERGMYCVNFSCRAGDMGNRRIAGISERILSGIRPGDIVLLHDCAPANQNDLGLLLSEFERLILGIKGKGLDIVPLERLTGRRVMKLRDM